MKLYNIRVNGKTFAVSVEDADGVTSAPSVSAAAAVSSAPLTQTAPAGAVVTSPMAGAVRSLMVKAGDRVNSGDLLLTLAVSNEESEIIAPVNGIVSSVCVKVGASVNTGDSLLVF